MSVTNYYVPNRNNIASITQANPCVITTTQNHGYMAGLFVRLIFPGDTLNWGMQPLHNQDFPITITGAATFSIPVNSTGFNAFNTQANQFAQAVPTGENALTLVNAVHNNGNIRPEWWYKTT